ncbi:type I methionyl aminopeptidase [Erysipelothrix rhusiopathiae]|uniref:Methionine aminopeptidase n=1 Tax=Erysipelothrix rhusiopathiae ATCC 19414 TaxID=525280 RepID=E7FXU3_ERYRH|nr:type I methionyl aminopeptidase [Erysipelothrix rhusiopathiae]AGN25256.1 methionine aminopeptidase [Erysipelothrix rhusiopathiae SY1027]AMS11726.1 type I methionyl aminopeptidase [Erysipelothrix rhusiopathiae]AOO68226.1 type I methionyl aminopeptidase [Erysipelothrix rhusiopathiae]AWU40925.1 type I methionyl aminopeptidase [Erysipelothrix rhusiopathiae]AYV35149.1 type I methionyl aminopeptidase [Erysipelothrix rhusiopathiae]
MITIKSKREIDGMYQSGQLLASIHESLRDFIKAGISTHDIDQFVQKMIEDNGAVAAQIGYEGYKYATCCSVNDEMCHGFPTHTKLKDGDLVKVDFCVDLNGFLSDSCWAYCVGNNPSPEVKQLMEVTEKALYIGIEQAQVGNRVGDIGAAMDEYITQFGYKMSLDFSGHGLGPTIHEEPMVPFVGVYGTGAKLKEGMVITVEPIVNESTPYAKLDDNGWTARTNNGCLSCQYEHTFAITKDGPFLTTKQK